MIPPSRISSFADADGVARYAAEYIADAAWQAVQRRGQFLLAVSGGTTPTPMFDHLTELTIPWSRVHLFQVDERVAPPGDVARNLTALEAHLVRRIPLPADQFHRMPVDAVDRIDAAALYAERLRRIAGNPVVLDLVHLGLGNDGHTASLVPGDNALDASEEVALTAPYQGHRRMTLTYPVLDRARQLLWVVSGRAKQGMVERLIEGDRSVPAGRVNPERAVLVREE